MTISSVAPIIAHLRKGAATSSPSQALLRVGCSRSCNIPSAFAKTKVDTASPSTKVGIGGYWRFKSSSVAPSTQTTVEDISKTTNSGVSSKSKSAHFVQWDGLVNGKRPSIINVRSLPFIGSMGPSWVTGLPVEMHNRFGEFFTFGSVVGGNPKDLYRTAHAINDPREFVKIIRASSGYPFGVVENLWVNIRWRETRGKSTALNSRGEEWRRHRRFLQTDLLHPDAARGYLPGIVHAARRASKGAGAAANLQSSGEEDGAITHFLNRCAFDMFSSIMFGIYTETADKTTPTDPEDERFVLSAVQGLQTAVGLIFSPYDRLVGKEMKFETPKMKHAFEGLDSACAIFEDKARLFMKRKENGELTENERASYLCHALDRQMEEGCDVTVQEVIDMAFTSLTAAVDTTSNVLAWNLLNIARLPDVQEKLYKEVSASVRTVGNGKITDDAMNKRNVPYLHAVIRETRRLTPTSVVAVQKTVDVEKLEVHGHSMNKGDVVMLESYTTGMNPELVDNPREFQPERWLQDAVEKRKGTPSEIIDHPFLAEPFSQGARKCPGSRVATNEIKVLLTQLVLDWKIASPVTDLEDISYQQKTMIEVQLPDLQFEARM